jgi:hypothetical protein
MAKRWAGSQTACLTPDLKKSGIDPNYLAADNVPHTVGKLSTRATTLLQTAFRSVERSRVYYKGEGGGFPQVRAVVSLVCPCCLWLVLAPSVLQLCTNHFVWVVCRPVWVSEACQLFLVPSRSSNTPFYPSKCCELGSVPRLLPLPLFSIWTQIWVL